MEGEIERRGRRGGGEGKGIVYGMYEGVSDRGRKKEGVVNEGDEINTQRMKE